ncbi:ABC transporter permease [Anaerocolumna xylanovorans]|uniref:ABC-type polysaccharide transport system, permease component n=1 Tax=Anaerocolumna xylanovorans DSM 12503 TaxID=1121345 RepID=A0A1M7Y538_9FIRM|nr:ABC transporter permease subunit [Anaerocolumna xylanovorans]SHO47507.1 ABC-type polysaccharide transport system, permease component [Anaerocolumna xylanovorans DSM 12503]
MKSKENRKPEPGLSAIFEKEYHGKKLGLLAGIVASVITLLLSIPFVKWIYIINPDSLFQSIGVKEDVIGKLMSSYNLYDMLSFVKYTKQGNIGLFTMILLILAVASVYFNIIFVIRVFMKKKESKGNLHLYFTAKSAMIFNIALSVVAIVYMPFANKKIGTDAIFISPIVYVVLILSIIAYAAVKIVEKTEREIYKEHGFLYELRKNWVLFAMLVPAAVYLLINNYLPMIGVYYAFTSFNFRDGLWGSPYVGMKNFEYLLKADLFKLTKNTVLYNFVFIALGNILQIVFAIFVSQAGVKWFKKTSQTLMFMPYFVSFVILKVLVYNLFEYDSGVVNTMVAAMGGQKIDFYNTPHYWPILITVFYIWKNIGYGMVVYLATIVGISDEYYDAAKVDGASLVQQIRYITLPLIKPTFIILFLFSLGSIMKGQFELFYQMVGTNGVLYNATDIFDTYVYRITTTQPLSIGIGTAAGLYQSLFGFVLIMVTNFIVKRKNSDYALF